MIETDINVAFMQNDVFIPELLKLVNAGHQVTIRARGYSMRPFIEHNRDDLVLGKLTRPVRVGDVVLAEISKGVYVCHRVDAAGDTRLRLRGDGNIGTTELCNREDVRAMLDSVVRLGKTYDLATSKTWKVYSWIWVRLIPARRFFLILYRLFWLHQIPNNIRRMVPKPIRTFIKRLIKKQ
ncbi:MAG: S24/S26 family peptidase [Bacteroidaceae bacterium]|nr:S24/S26 family peptidase [Bacteroidaceae bacterium]